MLRLRRWMGVLPVLLSTACGGSTEVTDTSTSGDAESPLSAVAETGRRELAGLQCPTHVLRVEGGIPHIYASDRADLARVFGFVQAQDRFFSMDLARRLGLGEVSSLLGDSALETDRDSRATGMTAVADAIMASLTPEHAALMDAYAEGINAYIAAVEAGELAPPSELQVAAGLLGASDAIELMKPFDRRGLAGTLAVLIYELGYETGDVGHARTVATLAEGVFDPEAPLAVLRESGAVNDLYRSMAPIWGISSAPGYGLNGAVGYASGNEGGQGYGGPTGPLPPPSTEQTAPLVPSGVPVAVLDRLWERMERMQKRLGRDDEVGWGSNAWAVSGAVSDDGTALVAGDGHLPLTVPSLFYSVGLDTEVLGGGGLRQVGLTIPGLPFMAVGTNGSVGWSQTQLGGDITDWYAEQLQLDDEGAPAASRFAGDWQPLLSVEETVVVADVPVLGSEGRTEVWQRYTTFDGRFIVDIEGTTVSADQELEPGQSRVWLGGDAVVPADLDGDGVISAVSFDYAGFEAGHLLQALDKMGQADDVESFRQATRHLVAYSQNLAAGDKNGSVLYTGFQALPCRGYLPRDAAGGFAVGADPTLLIDGTTYGGFEIPIGDDGFPVEGDEDPYRCVVPFDEYPQVVDPESGYVQTANNDPVGTSFDDDLFNDVWYIGGPWEGGFRAGRIASELERLIAAGDANVSSMAALQADVKSIHGCLMAPFLVEALGAGQEAMTAGAPADSPLGRVAALYQADQERFAEVAERLGPWISGECPALSGVETFYNPTLADDEAAHSVATSIFNAWEGRFIGRVFDDEGLPGVWRGGGRTGRMRAIVRMLEGRGPGNPAGLASWNPETGESAFFDTLSTAELETSDEQILAALSDALDFLTEDPEDIRGGGFGSADMNEWRWGLRHMVRFDSILGEFLGDDPTYSFLTQQFAITPDTLPLASSIASDDPRADLPHFPRPGDNDAVDAANFGFGGRDFTYSSGPVFRMVISLGPYGVAGQNILPGGQSALTDSPHFADQAALWLGNESWPLRFSVEDVVAGATGREVFVPVGAETGCP